MKLKEKLVMLLSIANCIGISSRRKGDDGCSEDINLPIIDGKMKISKMLLLAIICFFALNVAGQTVLVEQSQSRVIEPKQDVFLVPLIADIQVTDKQVRQDYGPYTIPVNMLPQSATFEDAVSWLKASALYRANREADSDVIVAATFNIKSDDKGKNYLVTVSGYPAKFINFRPLKLDKAEDYEWINVVYPTLLSEKQTEQRQTQAVKTSK